jgi:ankyrin repeat protein
VRLSQGNAKGEQTFQFAHFTVQEYLESSCDQHPLLRIYGISDTKADMLFMRLAIRFLTLKNFGKLPTVGIIELTNWNERLGSRPFYRPASTCWTIGALLEGDGNTQDLLSRLFHIEKTPNFCVWAIEVLRNCQRVLLRKEHDQEVMNVLTSVLRHEFTPLHMAAALGLADICQQLIGNGAKIDLMSQYGTPLHFAVRGLYTFSYPDSRNRLRHKTSDSIIGGCHKVYVGSLCNWTSPQEQQKTVRLFLSSKAKTDRRLSTFSGSTSLLTLAVWEAYSYEVIAQLIENGVVVEEEDLEMFDEMHESAMDNYAPNDFKKEYNQGSAFLRILNALRFHNSTGKRLSPEGRLFNKTVQFASSMALDVPSDLALSSVSGKMSDQYIRDSVLSAIENNDITLLETLLLSRRCQDTDLSELDSSNLDWSPIHIAVRAGSLDCLEFLLDWGLDPNALTADNKTPIYLCKNYGCRDLMQTLLKHGASTTKLYGEFETFWHAVVDSRATHALKTLIQLESSESRALALCAVSGQGDTPICRALTKQHKECVLLLLEFCNTEQHWKCLKPIYRAAAELGSSQVLDVLLDAGIEYDSHDEYNGNPLHWIHIDSSSRLIERLKVVFSVNQRRTRDSETPFQSLLRKATKYDYDERLPHAMSLLPDNLFTSPDQSKALWLFVCAKIIPFIMFSEYRKTYMKRVCTDLLGRGVAKLYEENSGTSALIPLARALKGKIRAYIRAQSSPLEEGWQWCSDTICRLLECTKYKNELAHEDSLNHLLCMAVLRDDQPMVGLLLQVGVNCHVKASIITPLELACLPSKSATSATLGSLLDHTNPGLLTQRITYPDLGPLHLIAGVSRDSNAYNSQGRSPHKVNFIYYAKDEDTNDLTRSLDKLNILLDAGADPNLPLNALSPMTYHILRNHSQTAEALLYRGADPWAQGSFSLDSVLAAVLCGNIAFLPKVAQQSVLHSHQPQWNRTYTIGLEDRDLCPHIHALHVAASYGYLEALEFYFDRGLVTNLDVKDGNQRTPMHYAASNGYISIIDYLVAHDCDINAASSSGLTPLHLAVQKHEIDAVESLLKCGAIQQPCHAGRSPLIYAYKTGDQPLISLLQDHSNKPVHGHSISDGRGLQDMGEALAMAISSNDLDLCQRICQLGCPLDVEVKPRMTPLVLAIDQGCSASLVEWFLNNTVRSSTLTWHGRLGRQVTALHLALMNPAYNSILKAIATKHIQDGDWSSMYSWNPLVIAIEHNNTAGLLTLLETLNTHGSAR